MKHVTVSCTLEVPDAWSLSNVAAFVERQLLSSQPEQRSLAISGFHETGGCGAVLHSWPLHAREHMATTAMRKEVQSKMRKTFTEPEGEENGEKKPGDEPTGLKK